MASPQENVEPQPLLPRIGMIWFFLVAGLAAVALGIIRAAEQGQALAAALVFCCIFLLCWAVLSGLCFVVAFLFGAMEKAMVKPNTQTGSPFVDGAPPPQIIPPQSSEDV